ncbi:hypothetical protein ElyMa_002253900 [Elysia marginata]|uniref:Secreted protein n=1 Tax=Elysia marginata TaxID=1093978 RepID=A0AAV4FYB7_9GAST|nr:hypothetical protein ElyMa_002253900 [Elysia marginata]
MSSRCCLSPRSSWHRLSLLTPVKASWMLTHGKASLMITAFHTWRNSFQAVSSSPWEDRTRTGGNNSPPSHTEPSHHRRSGSHDRDRARNGPPRHTADPPRYMRDSVLSSMWQTTQPEG